MILIEEPFALCQYKIDDTIVDIIRLRYFVFLTVRVELLSQSKYVK
jgi:hypothetical protein